jgi:hypothetical protein
MNGDSLLLPCPDPDQWIDVARAATAADPVQAIAEQVADYFSFNSLVMCPIDAVTGELRPPPVSHVLDMLARRYDLETEEQQVAIPSAGTVAVVSRLPTCDPCSDGSPARFDAELREGRIMANMCSPCFVAHSTRQLGVGHGQYLMLYREVPIEIRDRVDQRLAELGRQAIDWS